MLNKLNGVIAAIALVLPTVGAAQGVSYYYGGGVEITSGVSSWTGNLTESEGLIGAVSGIIGMKIDSGNYFYGSEVSASFGVAESFSFSAGNSNCGPGGTGPYMCSYDYAVRAVGIVGYDAGAYDLFASAGYGAVFGNYDFDAASGVHNNHGFTVGMGASYDWRPGLVMRGEVIYDMFDASDTDNFDTMWNALSLRVSLLASF